MLDGACEGANRGRDGADTGQRALEILQLALGGAEGVVELQGRQVDVETRDLVREARERHQVPPLDLRGEGRQLRELGDGDQLDLAGLKQDQPRLRMGAQHGGEGGGDLSEVLPVGERAAGVAQPDQAVGGRGAAAAGSQAAGGQALGVEAVGQGASGAAEPAHVPGQLVRGGGADVRLQHRALHLGVVGLHRGLGDVLGADAVDDLDRGQGRVDHEVVHVEDDAGAGCARGGEGGGQGVVPDGAPDHQDVGSGGLGRVQLVQPHDGGVRARCVASVGVAGAAVGGAGGIGLAGDIEDGQARDPRRAGGLRPVAWRCQ